MKPKIPLSPPPTPAFPERPTIPVEGEPGYDDEIHLDAWSVYYGEVSDALGIQRAIWSIFEVGDFGAVPFPGAGALQYKDALIEIPDMATWADLFMAADRAMEATRDFHHVFVESISPAGDGDGFVLKMGTGS